MGRAHHRIIAASIAAITAAVAAAPVGASAAPSPGAPTPGVVLTAPGLSAARETTGTAGTLNSVLAAPDGTIFGGDDRGVFQLTADGWSLIRPIEWVAPKNVGSNLVALQFSGWPGAMAILPGSSPSDYVIVAADGAGADIVRSADGGATWTTVKTLPTATSYDLGAVTGLCWSPEGFDGQLFALVQKTQYDLNPAYAKSLNRGASWQINGGAWPDSCDMGFGSLYAGNDPTDSTRSVLAFGTGVTVFDNGDIIDEEVPACLDDPAGFARGAISGTRVLLVTEDGCFARATYDPELKIFSEWTEGTMSKVGSVGIFSQGYAEIPTTMSMYGDTAYVASQAGVFAYSWATGPKGTWYNAGRGIPLRERVAVPTVRSGDRVILGGYQAVSTVLGIFTSSDAGKTFRRMTGVPASIEPRGIAMTGDTTIYLTDYDVMMETFDVWSSSNNGSTWTKRNGESYEGEPIAMVALDTHVYIIVRTLDYELMLMMSADSGVTFTEVDDTACGWANTNWAMPTATIGPGGRFVALHAPKTGAGALRGCTLAGGSDTAEAIGTSGTVMAGQISLIDFLDGSLRAYLGPTGQTNAVSLVSDDGSTWSTCTSNATLLEKQPAYISAIARDTDRSLIGTVVNPLTGTLLIRSTDGGCTWTWPQELSIDEEEVDMSSMVLPDGGEAEFTDLADSIEETLPTLGRLSALVGRAAPKVTAAIRSLRVIGPRSGSVLQKVRFGTAPSAPKKGTATVGKKQVKLAFTAPTSAGGGLAGYTATCSARGRATRTATAGKSATSLTVTGLVSKVSYTCTVAARDAVGAGAVATWTGLKPT